MATIAEQLQKSTVRIMAGDSTGTGFFFEFATTSDGKGGRNCLLAVVTNKHVISNATNIKMVLTARKGGSSGSFLAPVSIDNPTIVLHPNEKIDLACILIGKTVNELKSQGIYCDFISLTKEWIPNESIINKLTPVEDVLVVGYPNGIWDNVNNMPLFRKGITASDIRKDFRGEKKFIIDCSIFPGSSGSPVCIYNEGSYSTPNGLTVGTRFMFVGINSAVFLNTSIGSIVESPIETGYTTQVSSPNNLGIIIKSSELFELDKIISEKFRI